jgi:hypothetical protein
MSIRYRHVPLTLAVSTHSVFLFSYPTHSFFVGELESFVFSTPLSFV